MAAGGSGTRARDAHDQLPKQFRHLRGRPVWRWAFEVLAARCDPVVVVAPGARVNDIDVAHVVEGGATRQASVANGLAYIETDHVVVHDAARPLITPHLLDAVLEALAHADGSFTAVTVRDTLAHVRDGHMTGIVPRAEIVAVQTPQAFRTAALKEAHERATDAGITDASDDAQLLVHHGYRVVPVPGDERNLKLTYVSDLAALEMLTDTVQ